MLEINTKPRSQQQELGQYFTPDYVAEYMARWVIQNNPSSVLDPAVGDGVFLSKIREFDSNVKLIAYDVDKEMLDKVSSSFSDAELYNENYLFSNWNEEYDAIICNPPYNRFQNFDKKDDIIKTFHKNMKVKMSGLSNIYAFFLLKALYQLKSGGRAAFIIPYEFLSTGYGVTVKEEMLKSRAICKIILFKNIQIFPDVTTTTCIILMDKSEQEEIEFISVSSSEALIHLVEGGEIHSIRYNYHDLSPSEKWIRYCEDKVLDTKDAIPLSSYGKISRGIATGCNPYFTFNKTKADEYKLSSSSFIPCVTHSKQVKTLVFKKEDYEELLNNDSKVLLFNGELSSDENTLKYIHLGEEMGVDSKYLTSHRSPWYKIEERPVADIWVGVFNRDNIKFVMNEAGIPSLTTFHSFNLNGEWLKKKELVFCYLISDIADDYLSLSKREYGGGLTKFEPNDLNKSHALDLRKVTDSDEELVRSLYKILSNNRDNEEIFCNVIEQLNSIFRKYI